MFAAVNDDNPMLFFEHIALYRDQKIKQLISSESYPISLDKAVFRKLGNDLPIISYGVCAHKALACAGILEKQDGINCDVLHLRTLLPLDKQAICAMVKKILKVLLIGEDTKNGSILKSIVSQISESLFNNLDTPVQVLGSLDTPVPYAPPLDNDFLLSKDEISATVRELLAW